MSTPSEFYRHAVDLNRFSNAEAKQIAIAYNRLILQAVADLQILVEDERAFDRQTRLREIVRQLRASLDNWAGESSALLAGELQGLATFEEQFIRAQLLEMVPEWMVDQVRALQIDPAFARAVVMTDPIEIGLNVLSDDLLEAVGPSPATFRLTATQGAQSRCRMAQPYRKHSGALLNLKLSCSPKRFSLVSWRVTAGLEWQGA